MHEDTLLTPLVIVVSNPTATVLSSLTWIRKAASPDADVISVDPLGRVTSSGAGSPPVAMRRPRSSPSIMRREGRRSLEKMSVSLLRMMMWVLDPRSSLPRLGKLALLSGSQRLGIDRKSRPPPELGYQKRQKYQMVL